MDADDVVGALAGIGDRSTMERFLGEVLTPAEMRDLALRWELMRRIHSGTPQREVARDLHISLCKITRGARILKSGDSVTRKLLDEAERKEKSGGRRVRRIPGREEREGTS